MEPDGEPLWPSGHYYSPVPSLHEVRKAEQRIFSIPQTLPGIDLREAEQLALLRELHRYYVDQPFEEHPSPDRRYYFKNDWFGYGDAIILHCMLRHLAPKRVIEVGSGFSSALLLDTNELCLGNQVRCTFIEPHPNRLNSLLKESDLNQVDVIQRPLQEVELELFSELEAGDVLFVDSTHVSKVGSDVNRLILEILPRLARGVVVHVHDIFYPFEYPSEWIFEGRAWNEAYLLRGFLAFNPEFHILVFNSYLARFHAERLAALFPMWARNPGGSIWLQRRPAP